MANSKLTDRLIAIVLLVCAVAGCKQLRSLTQPTVLKSRIITWTLRSRIDQNQTTLQKVTQTFRSIPGPSGIVGTPPPK